MPFTQSFDQFFAITVMLAIVIYLLRTFLGLTLIVLGTIPSRFGSSARAAGQRITPRLIMRALTAFTGLLVATTGIGATTALATPESSSTTNSHSQAGGTANPDFDDLADLMAIDRGATDSENPTVPKSPAKARVKEKDKKSAQARAKEKAKAVGRLGPGSTITVREGDTLWSIADKSLGSNASDVDIDREWRRWHRVNFKVIGSNPHIIIPGMKLEAPRS